MNRELFLYALRKTKPVALLSIVLIALAGIFIQHCFLSAEAAKRKWEFCRRFDGDWYAYVSNVEIGQVDPVQEELAESARTYTIDEYGVQGEFSAYQYSEEAWDFFSYTLKEGDGFQMGDANQIIVSQGVADRHPVGTTIDIIFYSGPLEEEGRLTCEVVGVLETEEIIIPHNAYDKKQQPLLWNTDENFSEITMRRKFVILNPALSLEQMKACVRSQGMFFDRNSLESEEWVERLMKNGMLISMKETYQNSEAEQAISMHDMAKSSVLFLVAVTGLLIWGYVIIKKCREDICYLLRVGFSRKMLYGYLVRMNGFLLIFAFLLSFVADVLPNRYENTWGISAVAPLAAFAGYLVVWAAGSGMSCLLFGNCTFETQKRIPCIDDMSLLDNVRLCLLVQGYSARAATKVAYSLLEEKEIAFCAKRKMSNLVMEQRICFDEIVKAVLEG